MTIISTIGQWITGWTKTFEQGSPQAPTKPLDEFLAFLEGFPFAQVAGAALASGTNVPLDITAAIAIATDISKAFFSGQSVQAATMAVTTKVAIPPAVASQIIYDPVHPVDPMQFSRGR